MSRWQFSIRGLLVVTAIISVVLAVAVRLPTFFTVCLLVAAPTILIVAVLKSANFATSDHRPRLALLVWIALGSFFACYSFAILITGLQDEDGIAGFAVFGLAIMSISCVTCLARAWESYLLVGRPSTATDSVPIDPSEVVSAVSKVETDQT
jgi:hypothetical protein